MAGRPIEPARPAIIAALWLTACAASAQPAVEPPPSATPPPLQVQQVRPGLSVVHGAGGNVVVWSGADGVTLVDSGLASRSEELLEAVAGVAPGRLRFVVNTHGHVDHTGGNEAAAQGGAVLIGHERLREWTGRDPASATVGEAEAREPTAGARPVLTTTDTLALHLNGDRLDVLHVADAHTASDLVARWAQADVVALGDLYWSTQYPYIDVDAGGSLAGMVAAVEAALARAGAGTTFVPGHGPVTTRSELAVYRDMLVAVGRKVREAIEQGGDLEQVQAMRPTAEFDGRFARPGAFVSPEEFVRLVYSDLTRRH